MAVEKLKILDDFLKEMGYVHLIYISPTRVQTMGIEGKDEDVFRLLLEKEIEATYLMDRIELDAVPYEVRDSWFHDDVHLSKTGHVVWGTLIGEDLKMVLGY